MSAITAFPSGVFRIGFGRLCLLVGRDAVSSGRAKRVFFRLERISLSRRDKGLQRFLIQDIRSSSWVLTVLSLPIDSYSSSRCSRIWAISPLKSSSEHCATRASLLLPTIIGSSRVLLNSQSSLLCHSTQAHFPSAPTLWSGHTYNWQRKRRGTD